MTGEKLCALRKRKDYRRGSEQGTCASCREVKIDPNNRSQEMANTAICGIDQSVVSLVMCCKWQKGTTPAFYGHGDEPDSAEDEHA